MKMPKNFFANLFTKANIKINRSNHTVRVDFTRWGKKHDKAQDAMKSQLLQCMLLYVPTGDTMALRNDIKTFNETNGERDTVYAYNPNGVPYGHYQNEGVLYVDPYTGKGAFYDPEYGYWSRPGVAKVKTTELLHYSNPNARRDWLNYAADHHKDDVVRAGKRGFEKNV